MIRVRNATSRPIVRFRVGSVTHLCINADSSRVDLRDGCTDHHTSHELVAERGHGGISPIFVYPEDELEIACEIVPGEVTLLRSSDHNRRSHSNVHARAQDLIRTGRAHHITEYRDDGSVWGVIDEFDLLYTISEAKRPT